MGNNKSSALITGEDQFDDGLSLLDLIAFVQQNIRILLGGILIGGVLGLAFAFALPAQWEASALIRVGKLGVSENGSDRNGKSLEIIGKPIEPNLQVIDRIKSLSFQNDVLQSIGITSSESSVKPKNCCNSLKVNLVKSELIAISLRSPSPGEAKVNLEAVINELKNVHTQMMAPILNRWNQELLSAKQEMKRTSDELNRLKKILDESVASEKNFSQLALLSNILLEREREFQDNRERKHSLEEQLSPERTFSTDVLGQVEVSSEPVFPKKTLFAVIGLVVGLLLSLLLSMLKSICSQRGSSIKPD